MTGGAGRLRAGRASGQARVGTYSLWDHDQVVRGVEAEREDAVAAADCQVGGEAAGEGSGFGTRRRLPLALGSKAAHVRERRQR